MYLDYRLSKISLKNAPSTGRDATVSTIALQFAKIVSRKARVSLVPGLQPWNKLSGGSCLHSATREAGASKAVRSKAGALERDFESLIAASLNTWDKVVRFESRISGLFISLQTSGNANPYKTTCYFGNRFTASWQSDFLSSPGAKEISNAIDFL